MTEVLKEIEDLKAKHYAEMVDLGMENFKLKQQLRKQKVIFFEMLSNYAHWKAKALWRLGTFLVIEMAQRKERQEKLFRKIADKLKEEK